MPDHVYVRRRIAAGVAALLVVVLVGVVVSQVVGSDGNDRNEVTAAGDESGSESPAPAGGDADGTGAREPARSTTTLPVEVEVEAPPLTPSSEQGEPGSAGQTSLVRVQVLGGEQMAPKSVVASEQGILFAQNMMYRHSISVFRADGALVRTIPDSVDLSAHGVDGHPGTSKGAPVEMAFSPDGTIAWVSNYSMYGTGFGPEGKDSCSPGDGTDDSYVYKIDVATHEILEVIEVGAVPKYVAATPDGSKVLVTNWCTWDLSVIDTATGTEVRRVDLDGRYPRGIAVSADSRIAYVALMGSDRMVAVDLQTWAVSGHSNPGDSPRHVVMSPDGAHLYVSNNRDGNVVKIDRASGRTVGSVRTGDQPRSLDISSDGEAIYVVNYKSSTMSKVRTSDMSVMQTVQTDAMPIGITYEPTEQRVWVACYGGRILVFDDSRTAAG